MENKEKVHYTNTDQKLLYINIRQSRLYAKKNYER